MPREQKIGSTLGLSRVELMEAGIAEKGWATAEFFAITELSGLCPPRLPGVEGKQSGILDGKAETKTLCS
jgi:hypothetical protein